MHGGISRLRQLRAEHAGERDVARSQARLAEKLTAGLAAVKFEEGVHVADNTKGGEEYLRKAWRLGPRAEPSMWSLTVAFAYLCSAGASKAANIGP
jgi:hypothetical protein